MVTKKTATKQITGGSNDPLQFNPGIIVDPVPWHYVGVHTNIETQLAVAQLQLELHKTVLQARLDATNRMAALLKRK